jgi:hypothetical protein
VANRRTRIQGVSTDAERAITANAENADARLRKLEARRGRAGIVRADTAAKAGEFLNIEAPAAGITVILPEPVPSLRDQRVTLCFRNRNPVRIVSIRGLVNRETFVSNGAIGTFEAICDGLDGWSVETGVSSSGSALDAEFILGAAHGSLPSARVAADSTEIDVDLTVANAASWALRTASVVFSKLQNLTGLSVLGRAANSAGVMAAITATAARQVLQVNDAGTALQWGFPIEVQENGVSLGKAHTLNEAGGRMTLAAGVATLEAPSLVEVNPKAGGTENAYALPSSLRHGDILHWQISGAVTVNGIDATGVPDGFEFTLTQGNGGLPDGNQVTFVDESGSATAGNRIGTPDNITVIMGTAGAVRIRRAGSSAGGRWTIVERGFPRASTSIAYGGLSGREMQRAALTGAVTASANSNATAFGSAAAKSVLANATNAAAVPAFLAGSAAFQHLRVNAANTALEWAILSLAEFPTMAAGTVLANVTAGVAVPTAHSLSTLFGEGLTYTNVTGVAAVGAGDCITVGASTVGVTDFSVTPRKLAPSVHILPAGTHNDIAIADSVTSILVIGDATVTGIAGGWDGRAIDISTQGFTLTLAFNSAGSAVGNRLATPAGVDYVQLRGGARLIYDTQPANDIWRVSGTADSHENGSEIQLSSLTGNMGTIDISTLSCGGSVVAASAAASSAYSIEGFTAKTEGFWFHFKVETGITNNCTLFNEDATATAANRLRTPSNLDISSVGYLEGIFYYRDSRWNFIGAQPNQIANSATDYVRVTGGGASQVNIATATGDVTIAAGGNLEASGDNVSLDATASNGIVSVTSQAGAGGGAIQLTEQAASGATVNAGRGMVWVQNQTPSAPMFTDDTNVDREIATIGAPMTRGSSASFSTPFIIGFNKTSGTGAAGDDVVFNANAPFAFRIIACGVVVSTGVAASTVQWRSASGGGGNTFSLTMSTATTGLHTSAGIGSSTSIDLVVPAGGTLSARWTDLDVRAYVWALCVRT